MAVRTTTHADYEHHVKLIEEHGTYHPETGLRTVNRATVTKMHEHDGLTPAIMEAVDLSHERSVAAATYVATNDLVPRIEAAREAGNSPDDLKNTVRLATSGGSTEVTVRATRIRPNPRTGVPVTKHGVVGVSIDADKRAPHSVVERARTTITHALGLTEHETKAAAE